MDSVKYYKLRKIVGGLYVAFIIFMSLVPGTFTPAARLDPTKHDVLSHFTAYFIMMLWYARIYSSQYYPRLAGIFISLGIGLECLQWIIGIREFELIDMVFNSFGVLSAWLFVRIRFTPAVSK